MYSGINIKTGLTVVVGCGFTFLPFVSECIYFFNFFIFLFFLHLSADYFKFYLIVLPV